MDKTARSVLTVLIWTLALGQIVQIVTRSVLEVPAQGLEDVMLYPAVWLYILGAVNASREDTHIRATVLGILLKTRRQHTILAIVGDVLTLAIGIWLAYWAYDFTVYSAQVWKRTPTYYLPTVFADVGLLVGLVLMMLYTLVHMVGRLRGLAGEGGGSRG